jgi:hypothetical protein
MDTMIESPQWYTSTKVKNTLADNRTKAGLLVKTLNTVFVYFISYVDMNILWTDIL